MKVVYVGENYTFKFGKNYTFKYGNIYDVNFETKYMYNISLEKNSIKIKAMDKKHFLPLEEWRELRINILLNE